MCIRCICGYILHSGRPARSRRAFHMDMHTLIPCQSGTEPRFFFPSLFRSFVRSFLSFFFFLSCTDIYSYSFQQLFGGKKLLAFLVFSSKTHIFLPLSVEELQRWEHGEILLIKILMLLAGVYIA